MMRKLLLIAALVAVPLVEASAQPARALRSTYESTVDAVRLHPDGGLVVAGTFMDVLFPGGPDSLWANYSRAGFVARYDPDGDLVFAAMLPAPALGASHVAVAAGGEVIVAMDVESEEDAWLLPEPARNLLQGTFPTSVLLRLDATGWVTSVLEIGNVDVSDLAAIGDDALVAGTFFGPLTIGSSETPALTTEDDSPAFVLRLDAAGAVVWAAGLGAGSGFNPPAVAATPNGGAVLTGQLSGPTVVGQDSAGADVSIEAQWRHGFIVCYDAEGRVTFAVRLEGSEVWGTAIAVGEDGAVFATGTHTGEWSARRVYPSATTSIEVAEEGGIYLVGFTPEGDPDFGISISNQGDLFGSDLALVGDRIALVGWYDAATRFGSTAGWEGRLDWPGSRDGFLAMYERDGRRYSVVRIGKHDGEQYATSVASDGKMLVVGGAFAGALDVGDDDFGAPSYAPSENVLLSTGGAYGPFGFILHLTSGGDLVGTPDLE